MASVAPMIRSSTQLSSQLRHAKRVSMYNAFAGSAFLSEGRKSVISDWYICGRAMGENTSIDEKSGGGVCSSH